MWRVHIDHVVIVLLGRDCRVLEAQNIEAEVFFARFHVGGGGADYVGLTVGIDPR